MVAAGRCCWCVLPLLLAISSNDVAAQVVIADLPTPAQPGKGALKIWEQCGGISKCEARACVDAQW